MSTTPSRLCNRKVTSSRYAPYRSPSSKFGQRGQKGRKSRPTSLVRSLHTLHTGRIRPAAHRHSHLHLGFGRYSVSSMLDSHSEDDTRRFKVACLTRRSFVTEVVFSSEGVLVVLVQSGVCVAFSAETGKRLCTLNVRDDEVVRSMFHNKVEDALITVSVFRRDNFGSLKCRSVPMESLRKGDPRGGKELFVEESLQWPGFIEFDDVNSKVLTFSAENKVYRMWDLDGYRELFSIADPEVQELKISPGVVLLIKQREAASIPLSLVDINTGECLRKLKVPLRRGMPVDFIEQFDTRLMVKQAGTALRVIDLNTNAEFEVPENKFPTPAAFIFLYERQLFLTFRNNNVSVWNHRAEPVATFENQLLNFADINSNNIFITRQQDLILSYYKRDFLEPGVVNVSSIATGKCVATISHPAGVGGENFNSPLQDVTALSYNEERGEVYVGSRSGKLFIFKAGERKCEVE